MPDSEDIKVVIGVLNKYVEKQIKILTLDATANLIEDTPVKTGWARANWVPAIGQAAQPDVNVEEPNPSDVAGRRGEQQAGIAGVASDYKLPASVFISNHVPYINRLNEGHSKQAPSGFVQAAILKAVRDTFSAGDQDL